MEMLNNITTLLSGNMWTNIIEAFASWIVNYGWAIIVFTIVLKLVLSPLDVWQRISSKKQADVNRIMKPEMDALNVKYAGDREKLSQEQSKLYKKHGVSIGGMCLPMLVSIVATMVVFFTLFSGIRSLGDSKLYSTYKELDDRYIAAQTEYTTLVSDGDIDPLETLEEDYIANVIKEKYQTLSKQNSWLWVENLWKGDTKTSPFVNFNDYARNQGYDEAQKTEARARYDFIVGELIDTGEASSQNGYYVLIILAAVVSFIAQFIPMKLMSGKGQKMNLTNKIMMTVIPVTMTIFALNSNALFTIYIITNSLITTLISTITTKIINTRNKGKSDDEIILGKRHVEVVEYSRNYKK